jgi:hypothetical protein
MNNNLEKIKQVVFAKRPVLQTILKNFGNHTLEEYIKHDWETNPSIPKEDFLFVLQQQTKKFFNPELSQRIINQLKNKPLVSTVDHHGIWNHPIFVNSSLQYSLRFKKEELVIVLGTESVSLNNSCWAGSLLYHNKNLVLERSSFFTDKEKMQTVYKTRGIEARDIERVLKKYPANFKDLFKKINFSLPGSFSLQATQISQQLWEMVFPSAPTLIYLPLESLIVAYLLNCFKDPENIFSKIILSFQGKSLWQKYFGHEHTFMFWGVDEKGRRKILTSLPDSREELVSLMESKQIYPASPLCYCVLLSVGLACAGGFTQTTWLTEIKENFILLLNNLAVEKKIVSQVSQVPTQNFAESALACLKMSNGLFIEPSAVDLYLTGKDYYLNYKAIAASLTLEQSFNLAMPEIYNIIVPKAEQDNTIDLIKLKKELFECLEIWNILGE